MILPFVRRAVPGAVLLLASAASLAQTPQMLGFLEDRIEPAARIAFEKTSGGWKSFCPPDSTIKTPDSCRPGSAAIPTHWTVVYRGEPKGTVETSTYHPRFFADVGLFVIDDTENVPTVGDQDREFAGWIPHDGYRPLVVVAQSKFADPQQWEAVALDSVNIAQLWRPFKDAAGAANACSTDSEGEERTVPLDYQMKDVRVFQAYASKQTGERLVALQLDPGLNACDTPRTREWSTFWFHINAKSHIRPLRFASRDSNAAHVYTAKILDWGDYDGDGQTEIVFWLEGHNEDGYVLYYNNFADEATFSWTYRE